jgi:hypothetical protein
VAGDVVTERVAQGVGADVVSPSSRLNWKARNV